MSEQVPSHSTSSSARFSWSFDWRLHQSFYRNEEPVLFDRDGNTTIVTTTSPGLVKAAFYFGQRHAFWQLSVYLTQRLRDPFWVHLAGDIRRGLNSHFENMLTREEETIIEEMDHFPAPAIRLLFLFYNVLYREAPFPPYRVLPLPISQLPARVTENLSDATKAMWDAQVREESSQACTCDWLPEYFDTWKRVMELHLDIPLFPEGVTESRSRTVFGWILLRLSRDEVLKPWDSCLPGQEPACSLANGRVGHEEKARELIRRLKRCLWAWSADRDRDPVEDSEPDSDPAEQNDVMGMYTGVQHNEVEGPDAQYPNPVYGLPRENPNIDMPEDEQTRNRDPEDFVILQPSYPEDSD
ncbi:hypothetical protein QBC32DRAFT_221186 [Pseudoneurospora amorphoporcata]|uniref:Uncharacterized protein n=1 Tax=Pseudoneurospora amorphoporcata TaxID=241081 RepID=A0AAN6SD41_9PEZI|nr:hypothetical protein QBC32DRAFT_221186 [Pseudoneurospora amorphoporcata]